MTDPQDPPRVVDDPEGSERLRALVRECQSDVGTPEEVKRLESRLLPLIWAPSTPPPAGSTGTATTGSAAGGAAASGATLKAVTAVAVALGLAGGGLLLSRSKTHGPEHGAAPAAEQSERPSPATAAVEAERTAEPNDRQAQPNAEPAEADESAVKERPVGSSKERSAPTSETVSESESDLLGRAQSALRSDPASALALAAEHRKKFPNGVLAQEREVLSIEALERLGRHAEAVARADRFLKAFPGSAHRSKVNAVVGR
jgi:hypothetical protein